ncbi:hypothetical protein F3Y22_tig00110054pilonHSYRG00014 [Hibiscus syriacus]|uniref:Uncharacterized protein n=1 Tax=Hibiscus syriacus TaxID=106335 RepID=A0A6A3BKZ9_HIBSY|nr:uncharacterized protein LOC120214199 [Hibiscus syriacus]KAE8717263.1 hypothetical protein F3Y22_tig00110054pilonHSYRG00014 [Hibiscus syriacus]
MKQSSKPISSPCRPEKYPPQLMRFLRSKSSSRSRGGHVPVQCSLKERTPPLKPKSHLLSHLHGSGSCQTNLSKSGPPPNRRRKWIADALFCHNFTGKVKVTPQEKWGRSSSLAYRFWEAPLASHGTNEETELESRVSKEEEEEEKPESEEEPICENSNHTEENPDFCKEIEEKNEKE